jgi:hypothetical protein
VATAWGKGKEKEERGRNGIRGWHDIAWHLRLDVVDRRSWIVDGGREEVLQTRGHAIVLIDHITSCTYC